MSTGDVLAVVAATVVTMLVAVLATVLVLARRARCASCAPRSSPRRTTRSRCSTTRASSVHEAATEIDRVERLVTSAERLDEAKRAHRDAGREGDGVRHGRVARRATAARRRAAAPSRSRRSAGDRAS